MMFRKVLLFILIAVTAGAVGVYVGVQRIEPRTPQAQALARLFAQTLAEPAGGRPQALSTWRGKPLLINFWATWCGPCVEEMPGLAALHKQTPGLQVIGIGIDSAAQIAEFAARLKIDYPLYVADSNATGLMRELGNAVGGLPFTLLIGADGAIKKSYIGALDFDKLRQDIAGEIAPAKSR
jgi:thiol-disulfide isomerase/thioredoxin